MWHMTYDSFQNISKYQNIDKFNFDILTRLCMFLSVPTSLPQFSSAERTCDTEVTPASILQIIVDTFWRNRT